MPDARLQPSERAEAVELVARLELVVLVDATDVAVGVSEKLAAHRSGMLHRAFSVILLNSRGDHLLQQRALCKYHSGGLWSNACCGHPRPGEDVKAAAERRLYEEMGIRCELRHLYEFTYLAEIGSDLIEHEYDHAFVGYYDGEPAPDPAEVMSWRWSDAAAVSQDLASRADRYSAWLPLLLRGAGDDLAPAWSVASDGSDG